tara:strand:+ start:95698 stop:95808 length:111 start_codon:yes stop_codon:yes gene_type:complete
MAGLAEVSFHFEIDDLEKLSSGWENCSGNVTCDDNS